VPRGALLIVVLAAVAAASVAAARDVPRGLVGLLTPAQVPDGPPGCSRADTREALLLRDMPDSESSAIGTLSFRAIDDAPHECGLPSPFFEPAAATGRQAVPALESSYEEPALVVLEHRGDWYRIDLGEDSGWLGHPASFRFEAYPQLLAERLAYATSSWRGDICSVAGDGCGRIEPSPEQPLRVLGAGEYDGEDWIEVELTTDPCRDVEERVLMRGWIRAQAADGRPAAWFHSRGC